MDAVEQLVNDFYLMAVREDWRAYRGAALAKLAQQFGAASAAWWTHGSELHSGELTQYPQPFLTASALEGLRKPLRAGQARLEVPAPLGPGLAVICEHRDRGPVSTVFLKFSGGRKVPDGDVLSRICTHLVEAGVMALTQFVGRDDYLYSLGRTSRGSAAFVDSDGMVYASSPRFLDLLEEVGLALRDGVLPFTLPAEVRKGDDGDFVAGSLHVRVARQGGLFLLHARKPLPLDALSPREQEIARALGDGKTLKSIARQYNIAVSTVANHTTRIYRKLAIYRREDLVELMRARPKRVEK